MENSVSEHLKLNEVIKSFSTPEKSLRNQYAERAERFRSLNITQINRKLTPDELKEKNSLQEMANSGLFFTELTDSQLVVLEGKLREKMKVQEEFMSGPEKMAAEYRELGRKLTNEGLPPDELGRFNQLLTLAQEDKFE